MVPMDGSGGRISRGGRLEIHISKRAALAIEEVGKAGSLATLAAMPENIREQAPVGRLLEWHQLKQVGGLLIAFALYNWFRPDSTVAARAGAMADGTDGVVNGVVGGATGLAGSASSGAA